MTTAIAATCIGFMWRSRRRVQMLWLPVAGLGVQIINHSLFNWSMQYGGAQKLAYQYTAIRRQGCSSRRQ